MYITLEDLIVTLSTAQAIKVGDIITNIVVSPNGNVVVKGKVYSETEEDYDVTLKPDKNILSSNKRTVG